MSVTHFLPTGLPPPAWSDPASRSVPGAPASAPSTPTDWFADPTVARTLSIGTEAFPARDIDAWAQALAHHLVEPAAVDPSAR